MSKDKKIEDTKLGAIASQFSTLVTAIENEVGATPTTDDDVVKGLINRIYRKCVRKMVSLNNNHFVTNTTITLTSGTQKYSWSDLSVTDILKPILITDGNGVPIDRGDLETQTEGYILLGNQGVAFYPIPSGSPTYTLWYIQEQDDLSSDSDTPNFEDIVWDTIFAGACYLWYLRKKSTSKDIIREYKEYWEKEWEDFLDWMGSDISQPSQRVFSEDDGLE